MCDDQTIHISGRVLFLLQSLKSYYDRKKARFKFLVLTKSCPDLSIEATIKKVRKAYHLFYFFPFFLTTKLENKELCYSTYSPIEISKRWDQIWQYEAWD